MIKPQSIVIFPLLVIIALQPIFRRERGLQFGNLFPSIKIIIAVVITMFIVALPFIFHKIGNFEEVFIEPFNLIKGRFDAAYGQYEIASLNAFNFWGMVAMWNKDTIEFLYLTYKSWGTLIFSISYAVIIILIFSFTMGRKEQWFGELNFLIFQGITLTLFALFLFVTRAHERHFLPTIVFFTLITFRSWLYWIFYGLISFIHSINMSYLYLGLTHIIQCILLITYQTLVKGLNPGTVLILLIIFLTLLLVFIRFSIDPYNMLKCFQ